ncbi:MAG: PTS sugar transporter subunit IIA [Deltaproteobacteria bacterium]|nr:PTS sugar transporter subunit IIA [Deltaproteobacteria bacterium]MCB9787087.1 PTS sugar transporter subunit IIA [Deltaproteobacteria bacterium]
MGAGGGLEPGWIRLDVDASDLRAVTHAAAQMAGGVDGVEAARLEAALNARVAEGHIALGEGIAIPHAMVAGLKAVRTGLVRVRSPLAVPDAPDDVPVDLWFVVLGPPGDDAQHLVAVANVARLARVEGLLETLRSSADPQAIARAIASSEVATDAPGAGPDSRPLGGARDLVLIEIEGEAAVDRLLLDLAGHDFEDATVVDGLTLSEVASRELPLFASFRDLFGDPGGRRLILVVADPERSGLLTRLVRRACRETGARAGRVSVLPLRETWRWEPERGAGGGGH